jgi:hypothetical protein
MVSLDWTTTHESGVTFVTCLLDAGDATRRVRLRNELAGPLWPPRRQGLPEAGWTDGGFDGVVGPGTHALGYATPAPPADPPVTVVTNERVDADERIENSPAAIVRELGDPTPPREALPRAGVGDAADASAPAAHVPPAVRSWFADVRERVERAESGDELGCGDEPARTTDREDRASTLAADERALAAVADRTRSLSARLATLRER